MFEKVGSECRMSFTGLEELAGRPKMRTTHLLEDLEFHESAPNAAPLYVDEHGRVLRFTLKPGQSIREHDAPHSPFYVVV